MKIGYPCINLTLKCSGNKTFRLKSYSEPRLIATVESNLNCLLRILEFNVKHKIFFFRISSDLVPFASHPVNTCNWSQRFKDKLEEIGAFIKKHSLRISMHPDQFTLINSPSEDIFQRSAKELAYHTAILDIMQLDASAKIQIHVGGIYHDKDTSLQRFINRFSLIDASTRKRLVIENDDRLFTIADCLQISASTGIPVLFDVFHHRVNSTSASVCEALKLAQKTWKARTDGVPMVDYSSQRIDGSSRAHAESIDMDDFQQFLEETKPIDFDVMLEIKDKEKSAIKAVKAASQDLRFHQ
ncbi:MAG: UV DNA damage repair endonuclease UvsE [Candidatus Bathyarchaeota archaeon]|nr:UV DNA damage repair endonuclease UvsE [Candidatus Bathyarchaeota archaeon]